jgi:type III pantothenate kinase
MKLLIDVGNSRCKWACLDNQDLLDASAYAYKSEDLMHRVREVVEQICFDSVQEIHAVSVLGDTFDKEFCAQSKKLHGIETKFYKSQSDNFGVTLAYAEPLSYGPDRYAALVAAHRKMPGAKIIIDGGTATTIDVIDADGKHLGGLIIPGVKLMCSALVEKASGISMAKQINSTQLFNDNTADAVYSGSVLALSHGVRGIIEEIVSNINQDVTVCVTGGESEMIGLTNWGYVHCPNLVLEGLLIMQGS